MYRIKHSTDSADKLIWIVFKNEERYAMFRDEDEAKNYVAIAESGQSYLDRGLQRAERKMHNET